MQAPLGRGDHQSMFMTWAQWDELIGADAQMERLEYLCAEAVELQDYSMLDRLIVVVDADGWEAVASWLVPEVEDVPMGLVGREALG